MASCSPSSHDLHWQQYHGLSWLVDLETESAGANRMSKESLFGASLFPYLAFLWFLTKSGQTPKLALIGFYMTLVFVAITIPAGLYAELVLKQSLANVDWLHGGAESFLTIANILVVLGFSRSHQYIGQKSSTTETKEVIKNLIQEES
jgi:Protein of unknown function (DUF3593)